MEPLSFPRKRGSSKKAQATLPQTRGQAAIELAVFGAILVFILGTIVRTAVSNGYAQNENFKAMRMAMLASWRGNAQGAGAAANTSRNNASILFVEDRLSPDFNKYGDLDRMPFIAQGTGTFSYELMYPITDTQDILNSLPIMDVYINGQYFPFTTAAYLTKTVTRSACGSGTIMTPANAQAQCFQNGGTLQTCQNAGQAQCQLNQCLRNQREWVGGVVSASQFENILPVTTLDSSTDTTLANNATAIFKALIDQGIVGTMNGAAATPSTPCVATTNDTVTVNSAGCVVTGFASMPSSFYINQTTPLTQGEINSIQSILQGDENQNKLFYSFSVNGTSQFSPSAPTGCSGANNALCSTLQVTDAFGNLFTNTFGDMQYDLQRNGDYNSGDATAVETQFPYNDGNGVQETCSPLNVPNMRCYISWQWNATVATDASTLGLDATNNQYPQYDIDGRLEPVTIYGFSLNPDGTPTVTYVDNQGGDIDTTWDLNSCGPKPGLQSNAQIYTFTKQGTYLQILEGGKLFNPATDQFVQSTNQRNTIDLVQRDIQLSNNTGRFCTTTSPPTWGTLGLPAAQGGTNPVEICVDGTDSNCFTTANIAQTCYDASDNMLYVRSRIQDLRGSFWMTDTSGQLKVQ